ncbi:mitotic spindle assembly checkpoint protein MAD1-like isoform X2 [Ostrea edulis]|uniref:mitotic spindle assembly checkpoint protein MAD1-like isoform X2 n=1 Tax=Ostrea edulis TaxID=37623 RepID=UPI0024AF0FD0|nr:mitotic spindle assembly checkpoint protein MAD1-like isoform X2 [Ostrea edulis]
MEKPKEPKAITRMKRDLDEFISGPKQNRIGLHFNLDQDITEELGGGSNLSNSAFSMNSFLDKEKKVFLMKDVELKKAQCEINKLKSDLVSEQTSRKRSRIEFEKDLVSVQGERERLEERAREAKSQLFVMCDREQKIATENEALRAELIQKKKQYNESLSVMQAGITRLQEELQQTKDSEAEEQKDLCNQLIQVQSEQRNARSDLDETKALLEIQKNLTKEYQAKIADLGQYKEKYEKAEHRIKELEFKISQSEDDAVINRSMREKLVSVSRLENEIQKLKEENDHLRETQESNLLLKEQAENVKQKLERSELRCERLSQLEAENEELKEKLQKWEEVKTDNGFPQTPWQLSQRLAHLQESHATMLEKQGHLQSSLHMKEEALKKASQTQENLVAQLTTEKSKTQQQTQFIKRLQRKLLLISKERDMYKGLIDSYQSEVTVNLSATALSRMQQQEEILQSYKKQMESMETELPKTLSGPETLSRTATSQEVSQAEEKCDQHLILQLRERIAFLEKELEKATEEKCTLEDRIEQKHLQGDYDPTKLKVLHFSMNPAAMAQKKRAEELTKLREENIRLKKRVEVLEESKGQTVDVTFEVDQKMSEASSSKEVEEMKKMLETEELKNKRLLEVFKKTSKDLREVCYLLMGYKIDIPCTNKYKITSMFAASPEDFFMFEQSPSGEVQFLASDFAETLQDHIETYISKGNSIPAFLSAVTLELFNQQTVCHDM